MIPFHTKDLETLPWCLQGVQEHLHDVSRILVVCARKHRELVNKLGAVFVNEDHVVEGVTAAYSHWPRWGWYFQQVLKLGMAGLVATPYYFVVDADTIFLKDVALFEQNGKPLYAPDYSNYQDYFHIPEQVLGFKADWAYAFTVHHMVFSKAIVQEMLSSFTLQPWYRMILRCVGPAAKHGFNEQEVYGHYLHKYHPDEVNLRSLKMGNFADKPTASILESMAKNYDYVSLHKYMRRK